MAGFANGVNDVGLVPAYVSMEKLATSMFPTLRQWYENSLHFWLITTPAIYLYLAANESRKTVRGTKALKAKDRVTVVFCPFIDRHMQKWSSSKKSTLLRDAPSPLPYTNQKNAWVDATVYRHWWIQTFLRTVRARTDEPVALVMDNFSGHDTECVDSTGQVELFLAFLSFRFAIFCYKVNVFFFPPNSTSVHQPHDQGIISVVKVDYKKRMLTNFIDVYDNIEQLNQLASQAKKGRKGLNVPATILDATNILKEAWDNVSASTILGCWRHSQCLSHLPERISSESRPIPCNQAKCSSRHMRRACKSCRYRFFPNSYYQ